MFARTLAVVQDLLNLEAGWPAHGTRRRYRLELRHHGIACPTCAAANARYQRCYRASVQTDGVTDGPGWQQLELHV